MSKGRGAVQLEKSEETIQQRVNSNLCSLGLTAFHKKLLCAFLYWAEGGKTEKYVSFTNSNPKMIETFLSLMRSSFDLDEKKLRCLIHVHEYHDKEKLLDFWSRKTKIPPNKFSHFYLKKNTTKRKKEGYKGTLRVRYYDVKIVRELKCIYNTFHEQLGASVNW